MPWVVRRSQGHTLGFLSLVLESRSQPVERKRSMQKETEFTEVPQAEKHDSFEEAKEVQPGQSVCGMLKGRTREDAWPGHCRLCSGVLILP